MQRALLIATDLISGNILVKQELELSLAHKFAEIFRKDYERMYEQAGQKGMFNIKVIPKLQG